MNHGMYILQSLLHSGESPIASIHERMIISIAHNIRLNLQSNDPKNDWRSPI